MTGIVDPFSQIMNQARAAGRGFDDVELSDQNWRERMNLAQAKTYQRAAGERMQGAASLSGQVVPDFLIEQPASNAFWDASSRAAGHDLRFAGQALAGLLEERAAERSYKTAKHIANKSKPSTFQKIAGGLGSIAKAVIPFV